MGKEYSYLSSSYMSSLINKINKHAKYGWRLINVFHDGYEFIAVLSGDKKERGQEMLKMGDIIYKVTLEGYDIPCVVVKKYKVGQRLSKIDGTEGGGYLLKLAVRADQYLYLGDYIEDSEQTFVNLGIRPYSDTYIYVFDEKDIPKARKQILKNKIAYLQSELNYFKRRLDEEDNND